MADVATGITIVFGTSGFSANIIDVTPIRVTREAVQTSHQGTQKMHTYMPADLASPGTHRFTLEYDPEEEPPIHGASEEITITHPDGTTDVFQGFMTNFEAEEPLNQKMVGSCEFQITGQRTVTPGGGGGSFAI